MNGKRYNLRSNSPVCRAVIYLPGIFLLLLSACAPTTLTPSALTPTPLSPNGERGRGEGATPTPVLPTETPTPANIAQLEAIKSEQTYRATLSSEQQALFDQSADLTNDGLSRQFLENDLSHYLAYFDADGEVAYVWNFEQGKINPALKIDNNLLINEVSKSHIIWNPELDREKAQKTLSDYFKYARARVCAAGQGVQLPKTLNDAVNDPKAQDYLVKGCRVTLGIARRTYGDYSYDIPSQTINISGQTGIVIRFVDKMTEDMIIREGQLDDKEIISAHSQGQAKSGNLEIKYFHSGPEILSSFKEFKNMILARRISFAFDSLFQRASGRPSAGIGGDYDTVTQQTIFNSHLLTATPVIPLIIYSNAR